MKDLISLVWLSILHWIVTCSVMLIWWWWSLFFELWGLYITSWWWFFLRYHAPNNFLFRLQSSFSIHCKQSEANFRTNLMKPVFRLWKMSTSKLVGPNCHYARSETKIMITFIIIMKCIINYQSLEPSLS